jgi:hypothetical protein
MNARIVRFVAAVATAAVVSVMGAGLANASAADQMATRIATATGQQNTHSVAGYLAQMRDYLNAAVTQEDVEAVNAAIKNLRPVLGVVREAPVERAAAVLNDRADAQAAQIERDLPGLGLLAPITGLVTSLLTTILDLVTSLLGGLPVPLPLPDLPLPGLPLPELPGVPTPELPVPAPPDAPAPAPELPVPAPEVPPVPAP